MQFATKIKSTFFLHFLESVSLIEMHHNFILFKIHEKKSTLSINILVSIPGSFYRHNLIFQMHLKCKNVTQQNLIVGHLFINISGLFVQFPKAEMNGCLSPHWIWICKVFEVCEQWMGYWDKQINKAI